MLMPRRLRLIGKERSVLIDSSAVKPLMVSRHSESTPPTNTASHSPWRNSLRAEAKALALDVQAVDTV